MASLAHCPNPHTCSMSHDDPTIHTKFYSLSDSFSATNSNHYGEHYPWTIIYVKELFLIKVIFFSTFCRSGRERQILEQNGKFFCHSFTSTDLFLFFVLIFLNFFCHSLTSTDLFLFMFLPGISQRRPRVD